jgi:hypothetical protein
MSEKLYTGLEPKNDNLVKNSFGMRVHATSRATMVGNPGTLRPPFGGTYEQSLVPNPLNSNYDTKSVSDRGDYKKCMKSKEELEEMR